MGREIEQSTFSGTQTEQFIERATIACCDGGCLVAKLRPPLRVLQQRHDTRAELFGIAYHLRGTCIDQHIRNILSVVVMRADNHRVILRLIAELVLAQLRIYSHERED